MDNIKKGDERNWFSGIKNKSFSEIIRMEFDIEKCIIVEIKSGRLIHSAVVELLDANQRKLLEMKMGINT